ncbi:DNA polymerase nu-like [Anticarsia gemmatalis]|uniref:DNA polymerase nu-like n=1 Tax=Anticarsia gemmatalis TaxID=129554 RepID=UPI003F76C4FA
MFYCFKNASQKNKESLTQLLKSTKVISYDARNILIYLKTQLQIYDNTFSMYDAKIGASLLDPDNPPENFSELQKLLSFTAPYTIATECPLQKAAWYLTLLRECWSRLNSLLVEKQLWQVFVDIEMKLLPIIAEMERRGVSIDLSKLKSMEEVLVNRTRLVEQACYKAAGKVFQINSTVQVRSILYDELQLDTKCNVKVRETLAGGVKSTSEIMLRSLMSEHPLPKLILEYRHLHKAHATFLAGIAQHVRDGVVRPTWVQTAAATGRIASNNPNLQAIPKVPFSLVMFPDDEDKESVQLKFRSVYVAGAGQSLLAADFQHVECRVFAHVAADTALLRALAAPRDLFVLLAAQWLNVSESAVCVADRERTKRLVYASLYGAGTRKLMEILDLTYEHALQVAASFNRTFPSLKSFGRRVVWECSQAGGRLSTLSGRARHFAHINSKDFALKSHAERQAVNFIVQGSAADICKMAMILTEAELRSATPPVDAHLVLQIHDELVWEVRDEHIPVAAGIIKRVMEGCGRQFGMSISLPVAISVGKNWGEMEDYNVPV